MRSHRLSLLSLYGNARGAERAHQYSSNSISGQRRGQWSQRTPHRIRPRGVGDGEERGVRVRETQSIHSQEHLIALVCVFTAIWRISIIVERVEDEWESVAFTLNE